MQISKGHPERSAAESKETFAALQNLLTGSFDYTPFRSGRLFANREQVG